MYGSEREDHGNRLVDVPCRVTKVSGAPRVAHGTSKEEPAADDEWVTDCVTPRPFRDAQPARS